MIGDILLDPGIPWDEARASQLLELVKQDVPQWKERRRAAADAVRAGLPSAMHPAILRFLNLSEAALRNVDHVDSALPFVSRQDTDRQAQATLQAVVFLRKRTLASWAEVNTLIQRHLRATAKAGKV